MCIWRGWEFFAAAFEFPFVAEVEHIWAWERVFSFADFEVFVVVVTCARVPFALEDTGTLGTAVGF